MNEGEVRSGAEGEELIREGCRLLGLKLDEEGISRLLAFLKELERWNRVHRFVKALDRHTLITRHLLDCLAGAPLLGERIGSGRIADVGSGAGFPGIPLAIALPGLRFTLVERSPRRCAFLSGVILGLPVPNAEVVEADYRRLQLSFEGITCRALAPMGRELPALLERLRPGGWLAAFQGRRERLQEEIGLLGLDGCTVEIHPIRVPFLEAERHLLLVRRFSPCV